MCSVVSVRGPGDLFSVVVFVIGSCQLRFRCFATLLPTHLKHKRDNFKSKERRLNKISCSDEIKSDCCIGGVEICFSSIISSPSSVWALLVLEVWDLVTMSRMSGHIRVTASDWSIGLQYWPLIGWLDQFQSASSIGICVNHEKNHGPTNKLFTESCFTKEFPVEYLYRIFF